MRYTRILRAPRGNLTGFDPKALAAASGAPANDPWAKARFNRFKNSFPGLGIATVAFAAYCGYEYLFLSDDHHGHSEGHGEEHH
ncbi:NADh-ubiquinone oxidoreductase b12 subunit family protein [Rutstroemia sp. NJR-2017a BBW]|nr:NADh-ubiquinone oxidoreductase b12 subunit family protein [Rutstroemia sp. NJR-2017a BBW]